MTAPMPEIVNSVATVADKAVKTVGDLQGLPYRDYLALSADFKSACEDFKLAASKMLEVCAAHGVTPAPRGKPGPKGPIGPRKPKAVVVEGGVADDDSGAEADATPEA